jgi:hypothetical protein
MKIKFLFCVFIVGALWPLFSAELSGVLDSTFNYTSGGRDGSEHSFGLEEYANLRLRVKTGEKATFFAAINLIALSGNYLENAGLLGSLNTNPYFASTPFISGYNYAAALELERLYFRINGDYLDSEAGLLRLNFGYGGAFSPSDFLNPKNPLFPNARPRGVLAGDLSFYPADTLKLMAFAAAPKNPLESSGGGFIPGLSLDQHWDKASLQFLYAYETPSITIPNGIHRFGLSLKADLELGFVADALYTLNQDKSEGIEGLSCSSGFDYNFFGGDLYILFEYLYSGYASVSALGYGGAWINHHYLFGSALYRFNDYCSLSLAALTCLNDASFSPFVTLNYEVFQGLSLNLTGRFCLDSKDFSGDKAGELGPDNTGARFMFDAGLRLRF